MKRIASSLVLAAVLAACGDTGVPTGPDPALQPAMAAVAITDNVSVPVDLAVVVPCAAGGAGELVLLSGELHILLHLTIDNRGGFHLKTHFQPKGVSGVGQTTGDKYQATGVTQDHQNLTGAGTFTFVNNFRIIGQGPGNNFLVHQNVHVTVNANGEMTADVANTSVVCK